MFAFFDAIGRPELKTDPRFSTVPARFANVKEYFEIRVEALKAKTTAEWLEIFDRADVPAMPYHTLDSLLEDPHLADVGFFELKDHPTEGKTRNMRLPNKWSSGVRREWNPAPKLGQHSVEILREIGCDGRGNRGDDRGRARRSTAALARSKGRPTWTAVMIRSHGCCKPTAPAVN